MQPALSSSVATVLLPLQPLHCRKHGKKKIELNNKQMFLLLREVMAQKAHVAALGSKKEAFNAMAEALSSRNNFEVKLDGKSIRDR